MDPFEDWLAAVAREMTCSPDDLRCVDAEMAFVVGDSPADYARELAVMRSRT